MAKNKYMDDLAQLSIALEALDEINLRNYMGESEFKEAVGKARMGATAASYRLSQLFQESSER